MDLISKVSKGDPVSASGFNRVVDVANAIALSGGDGIDVSTVGRMTVSRRDSMQFRNVATPYPAVNIGTTSLGYGDLACLHMTKHSVLVDAAGVAQAIFRVSKYDTASASLPPPFAWCIVNESMDAGKQGSVFVDGLIWVRAKVEDANAIPAGATYTDARCVTPVDGETYLHIVHEGPFQMFGEEYYSDTNPVSTTLHWVLIRFHQARLPVMFKEGDALGDRVKAKAIKLDGTEIGKDFVFDVADSTEKIPVQMADGRVVLFSGGGGSFSIVQTTGAGASGAVTAEAITMNANPADTPNFSKSGTTLNLQYFHL